MNVWDEEIEDNRYALKPVTKRAVTRFEKRLKLTLPKSYKELVHVQNGGSLQFNLVKIADSPTEKYLKIDHIYGIGSPGLVDSPYLIKEWGLPEQTILFSGDGNAWFAFDYSTDAPTIVHIEGESNEVTMVAPCFEEFLRNLTNVDFGEEDGEFTWTREEADVIFIGKDEELIQEVLFYMQYDEDVDWYVTKLAKLSEHSSLLVREAVVSVIETDMDLFLVERKETSIDRIKSIVKKLSFDEDEDIRRMIEELRAEHSSLR